VGEGRKNVSSKSGLGHLFYPYFIGGLQKLFLGVGGELGPAKFNKPSFAKINLHQPPLH
jgi:hypothetical protein